MATLTIRNLPDDTRDALRISAAKNGRSLEAEVRAILVGHTGSKPLKATDPDKLLEGLRRRIKKANKGKMPQNVVDQFLKERRADWGEE
jgi:hypothetical protein